MKNNYIYVVEIYPIDYPKNEQKWYTSTCVALTKKELLSEKKRYEEDLGNEFKTRIKKYLSE